MGISAEEIMLRADQTPGRASFNNFDEVKKYLEEGLSIYNNTTYSLDNIDQARNDLVVLKEVKKKLSDKKKELERAYTMPIGIVMAQLDELIAMVKEPYDIIDRMIRANAKAIKERDIFTYAHRKAQSLGVYREKILSSPAFFNPRWRNATYREREWKKDVDEIISKAEIEIPLVRAIGGDHTGALLAFYFDKLSFSGVEDFLKTLEENREKQTAPKVGQSAAGQYVDSETGEIIEIDTGEKGTDVDEETETICKIVEVMGKPENVEQYLKNAVCFEVRVTEQ